LIFLSRGAVALSRLIGFESYFERVMHGTPDAEAFRDPEIRAAIVAGSEIVFGPDASSYEAFAADIIAVHRDPWPDLGKLGVPVTLVHGEQDTNSSYESAAEHSERHPDWQMISFPNAGNFVHHVHWRSLVEIIADNLPGKQLKI